MDVFENTPYSQTSVPEAARLGFGDALYFSRRFRQKTGSGPSQSRKALVLNL